MASLSDTIDQLQAQPVPASPAAVPNSLSNSIDQVLAGNNNTSPPDTGSFWSNTGTALARGVGQWVGPAGAGELMYTQTPEPASSQEISNATTNLALGGAKPYEPKTAAGHAYQDILANTVASAPLAALLAPTGIPAALAGQGSNLLGNIGSYTGEKALPSHPVIGGIVGGLVGGLGIPAALRTAGEVGSEALKRLWGSTSTAEQRAGENLVTAANQANKDSAAAIGSAGAPYVNGRKVTPPPVTAGGMVDQIDSALSQTQPQYPLQRNAQGQMMPAARTPVPVNSMADVPGIPNLDAATKMGARDLIPGGGLVKTALMGTFGLADDMFGAGIARHLISNPEDLKYLGMMAPFLYGGYKGAHNRMGTFSDLTNTIAQNALDNPGYARQVLNQVPPSQGLVDYLRNNGVASGFAPLLQQQYGQ